MKNKLLLLRLQHGRDEEIGVLQLYQQYDDEDIGALDQDDIAGHVQSESQVLQNVLQEFEMQQDIP